MKEILIFLYFGLITFLIYGQESKRDNIWMLGTEFGPGYPKFGIDFNLGTADTFSLQRPMGFYLTNASICDTNGNLLFYTNGNYVANRKHEQMPSTANFNPGDNNTETYPDGAGVIQGAIILPWPGNSDLYAIFHISGDYFTIGPIQYERALTLRYSQINMALDSGYGDFTGQKNVTLILDTLASNRIVACKHANGRDWWILAHELWSDKFFELLLTPNNIQTFQTQNIGSTVTDRMDILGSAAFSPKGEQLACLYGDTTLNIFNFDRCTGLLSDPVYVYFPDTLNLGTIGCAFSESGRYLYVCNNFHIFQLDMDATDIAASKTIVATYDNFHTAFGTRTTFFLMALAPDNKIYISTFDGSNIFHVINAPDSSGSNCNVTQHNFHLPNYSAFSMPNVPNYALGSVTGSVCDSLGIIGITEIENNNSFILYPNPSTGKINIKFKEDFNFQRGVFEIFNSLGAIVFSKSVNSQSDLTDIDIHDIPNGVYSCHLINNNLNQLIGKLSIVH